MPISYDNPDGRLDVAALRLMEHALKRHVPNGGTIWDRGLGAVTETFITERLKIPSQQITAIDLARGLGILPPAPKEYMIDPPKPRARRIRGRR